MDPEAPSGFPSGPRPTHDPNIEESGLLGTHRRWTNINRYEIIFLIVAILATIVTDGLTIVRLSQVSDRDPDFAYAILILVNSVFLLLFLITGILFQRVTDIVAFFISAVMLTIYVIVHYITRSKESDDSHSTDAKLRLIRLVFTIVFNVLFIPLSIIVIQDYRRDEFNKRLFGAFPAARRPVTIYNIFDCLARINTMLSISLFMLNLYNFNQFETVDKILLGVGIPFALLWLGLGVGMVRLESYILVGFFYLVSLFQPGFIIYCLYSVIEYSSTSTTIPPLVSTSTPFVPTSTTTTPLASTSTSFVSTSTSFVSTSTLFVSTSTSFVSTSTSFVSTSTPQPILPISNVIYVCVAANFLVYILALIFSVLCIRNFGKDLKQRVFNNQVDKLFQKCFSKSSNASE